MSPSERWKGRVALVTGASSGIGRAVSLALAQRGAEVALLARNRERLGRLADSIREESGRESLVLQTDVSDASQVGRAVALVLERHGRIDYLINSAGIIRYKPFLDLSHEEMAGMMAVNYFGTVHCIRAVLPQMLKRRSGQIVNIASTAGRRGFPMETGYSASKFAVVGMSEALRLELSDTGVSVSLLCPGFVDTPMAADFLGLPGIREEVRPMTSETIAGMILDMIENKTVERIVPWSTRLIVRLNSWFPSLTDRIILRRVKRISRLISNPAP